MACYHYPLHDFVLLFGLTASFHGSKCSYKLLASSITQQYDGRHDDPHDALVWTVPAAVLLYYVTPGIWQLAQQQLITKRIMEKEKLKAEEAQMANKSGRRG